VSKKHAGLDAETGKQHGKESYPQGRKGHHPGAEGGRDTVYSQHKAENQHVGQPWGILEFGSLFFLRYALVETENSEKNHDGGSNQVCIE